MTPIAHLYAKAERADQHIKELDRILRVFLDESPYRVSMKGNPQTGEIEWRLDSAKDIPLCISAIAGDAIQNLRSVLDHMVHGLVIANRCVPKPGVTGFPICETAQEYAASKTRRKIEGIGQIATDSIDALEPYKGGNETLWRLHRLNNVDKHRLLIPAAAVMAHHDILPSQKRRAANVFRVTSNPPNLIGVVVMPERAIFPLEVGKVFFTLPREEMENNFKFALGVSLNEPGVLEGEEIMRTVKHFSNHVRQILKIFDALL